MPQCLEAIAPGDFSIAFDEVDRLIQCNYPPQVDDEEDYYPDAEEFRRICETLDDRDRWLAEVDRNGWALAFLDLNNRWASS